jgi:sulfite reductase (NADPH) flavoprotein alpha-component
MREVPVIPENAPFQLEQRLWLNGFLAGYFSRQALPEARPLTVAPDKPSIPLLIVFGSQTGTAQALAQRFAKLASTRGFDARLRDAAEHGKIDWHAERTLMVVTSTYGDGDMPDNAQGFWDWLQTDSAKVSHLRFAVLALGDRNYSDFCGAGRKIDARLENMGAHRFFNRADCDVDYDTQANAWIEGALTAAQEALPVHTLGQGKNEQDRVFPPLCTNGHSTDGSTPAATQNGAKPYSKTNPLPAPLLKNLSLNKPGSGKEVRHFELDLRGSNLVYEPGDTLGVVPHNCSDLVDEVLRALQATGEEAVKLNEKDVPLREALTSRLDITKPSSALLAEVARRAPASDLANLMAPERAADLKQWLWGRDIVDLLLLLPLPFACTEFVTLLRNLSPRLYSISSSPKAHPGEVHLTVSALRYERHGRKRKGVASTYLADRVGESNCVEVFIQPSGGFKLPQSGDVPIIMVGPGTGIAPFRAFIEERQTTGAKGKNWLFFGEQKRAVDFLYEDQLTTWHKEGHLSRLDIAFSRDQVEKIYVQHLMLEKGAELWAWLQEGAHFYVCGDANRMAKDVDAALHAISERDGGLTSDEAKEFVHKLKTEKRYQRDIY